MSIYYSLSAKFSLNMKGIKKSLRVPKVAKYKVVFVRHGESEFNKLNRFTGWQDVRLTDLGVNQAQ